MSETDGSGTIYGSRRAGLPRDPLLLAALAIGLAGVLVGVLFATGVLGGDPPSAPATAAGSPTPTEPAPSGSEPAPSGGEPAPVATAPEPSPTADPEVVTGPRVFHGVGSGLCLGLDGAGERAAAELAGCTGGPEQQWTVNRFGPDTVTLTNVAHGQCLDVEGGSGDDSARLLQYGCHGESNQQWRLQPAGDGATLLVAVHSGKCAQVHAGGTGVGDGITQAPCDGNPAQRWMLR